MYLETNILTLSKQYRNETIFKKKIFQDPKHKITLVLQVRIERSRGRLCLSQRQKKNIKEKMQDFFTHKKLYKKIILKIQTKN